MNYAAFALAAGAALVVSITAPAAAGDTVGSGRLLLADIGRDVDAVSEHARPARVLRAVPPEMPAFERSRNMSGSTRVLIDLDASGRLTAAQVVSPSGRPHFDRNALAAVRASTYAPEIVDDRPIGGTYVVDVTFDPSF